VKLYFPRMPEPAVQPDVQAPQPNQQQTGSGERVLVVEDEDDVRRFTVEILTELGYKVVSASNGTQALSLIDQHPDIVLLMTDVVMPGMNGRKLAEAAIARRPGLKILFTTGYTRNAIVHNGVLDAGVELIIKPFTLEGLATKIAKVLSG